MMGLVCCAGPLVVFATLLLAFNRHEPESDVARHRYKARMTIGFGLLVLGLLLGLLFEPFVRPERYTSAVAEHAAPLIAAIDAFDAAHGSPPTDLSQLLPESISSIPTTGFRGEQNFSYEFVSSQTQPWWRLRVWTGGWMIDDMSCFYFDSWSRRWLYSDS